MRVLSLCVVLMLLVACVPKNIARASCQTSVLSTVAEKTCTVTADVVGQTSSIEFDSESRNQVAHVSITLRVTKGKLRVGYYDLSGEKHLLVTPSEPADLNMQTRMHRERRSFTLMFEPVDGAVEGLAGTVKFSTP